MRNRWLLITAVASLAVLLTLSTWRAVGTAAQMGQTAPLDQLSGDDLDRTLLNQMVMHHAVAVTMARPAAAQPAPGNQGPGAGHHPEPGRGDRQDERLARRLVRL